jgi:hypothetical protein
MVAQKKADSPVKVPIYNPGAVGVIQDVPGHELPPEAWTTLLNVRCRKGNAERGLGNAQIFGTPSVAPSFVFNVPGTSDQTFWLYFSLTKAYEVESGVHTEITRAAGNYTTVSGRDWCGTLFGGVPIFTNNADVPQYWPTLSAATDLIALPNWDANKRAKIIRAFGSYLFALNITETGTNRPHKVLVSHKADPGSVPSSWDPTDDTVDAIEFELIDRTGGELLDGLPLGSSFIAYKKNSTHIIRFVGGTELWARDLLLTNSGILASRCVCDFDNGTKHFVVTQNDIIIHAGTKDAQKVAEGKNKDTIFAEIDSTNYYNSFVFENPKYKEVWFCYPTNGQTVPNRAFIYNYQYNTQYFFDFAGLSAAIGVASDASAETWAGDSGLWSEDATLWSEAGREAIVIASPSDTKLFKLDSGLAFGSSTPTVVLERIGLAITGRDRQGNPKEDFSSRKLVTRIWPKFTGSATWQIQVGAQEYRDAPITWSTAQTFDPQTMQYLDVDTNGRLIGVRIQQNANVYGVFEGYDLRMALLGEF